MPLTLYTLASCDTCRKAAKWLRARKIAFAEKPIRETPPTVAELRAVLVRCEGDLGRLFNRGGNEFRALGLKEKLPQMTEAAALALLASNGSLVKRPLLVGRDVGLVGHNEAEWSTALRQ